MSRCQQRGAQQRGKSRPPTAVRKVRTAQSEQEDWSGEPASMASTEFDSLRREATKLERHLQDKVAQYQELAQRLNSYDDGRRVNNGFDSYGGRRNHQQASLLDSAENGTLSNNKHSTSATSTASLFEEEAALSAEISRTASSMSDLITRRMAPAAERTGRSQHALLVKRYREIVFDCTTDFQKTSAAVARKREAAELFRGANTSNGGNERDSAAEHLLRERNAIGNSLESAASVLGQAAEIHSDLRNQGQALRGIQGTMAKMTANVPGLNRVIESIRVKRSRDDLIVSGVIATCILFTLWYVFS